MPEANTNDAIGRLATLLVYGAVASSSPLTFGLFLFTQSPIWRVPGTNIGVGLLDYVDLMMKEVSHIPIEEAIDAAKQYYIDNDE